jgi:hypothetical protein
MECKNILEDESIAEIILLLKKWSSFIVVIDIRSYLG